MNDPGMRRHNGTVCGNIYSDDSAGTDPDIIANHHRPHNNCACADTNIIADGWRPILRMHNLNTLVDIGVAAYFARESTEFAMLDEQWPSTAEQDVALCTSSEEKLEHFRETAAPGFSQSIVTKGSEFGHVPQSAKTGNTRTAEVEHFGPVMKIVFR